MPSQKIILVWLIILFGLVLRLYKINLPLLDSKPHREIHTAEETRNLYYDHELYYPKSKLWGDEPGYYLAEFPVYNLLVASIYSATGQINEIWGKVVSVFVSVFAAFFLYKLARKLYSFPVALAATFFYYVTSPQSIIMSRSYQPDQLGLTLGIASLYFFYLWIGNNKKIYYFLAVVLTTITLLVKISFFPFLFPMVYLVWRKKQVYGISFRYLIVFSLCLLPALLWIRHIQLVYLANPQLHSVELVKPQNWIQISNLSNIHWLVNISFDFVDQVLTLPVLFLVLLYPLLMDKKHFGFLVSWLIGLLLYGFLFIGKIYFWYYQVPFIFPLVIAAGFSSERIYANLKKIVIFPRFAIVLIALTGMIFTSRPYILRTYQIASRHAHVLEVATIVKQVTPPNSKILTSSYNSGALTYYSLRRDLWGATLDINEAGCDDQCLISKTEKWRLWGAKIYAVADTSEFMSKTLFLSYLKSTYKIISETPSTIVFDLSKVQSN